MIKFDRSGEHRIRCSVDGCEAELPLTALPFEVGLDGVPRLDRLELALVIREAGWAVGVFRSNVLVPGQEQRQPEPGVLCPLHVPPQPGKAPGA